MTLKSHLDQPFNAEIELIDVGNTPLNGIKANLASVEDYEKVGMQQAYALSYLSFNVEKNAQGKPVIKLRSSERISDPYMQLLVDLAWANGQIYRSYTILLDPPNYNVGIVKTQLRNIVKRQSELEQSSLRNNVEERASTAKVVDNRDVTSYGPTVANETVWQIAQRYKTDNITLQQLILAIVGSNPEAFTEGNLNGLKEGSRLLIPTASMANRVPMSLAKLEVMAHDSAWQSRNAIDHALLPPYINSTAPVIYNEQERGPLGYPITQFIIPPIIEPSNPESDNEHSSHLLPLATSLLSLGKPMSSVSSPDQNLSAPIPQANIKAEASIVVAANKSAHEANAVLIDQLRSLQTENKNLHQQSIKREQEIAKLREQIRLMIARQGLTGQASQQQSSEGLGDIWLLFLFLVGLGVGGGLVYWRLSSQQKKSKSAEPSKTQPLILEATKMGDSATTVEPMDEMTSPEPAQFNEHSNFDNGLTDEKPSFVELVEEEKTIPQEPLVQENLTPLPAEEHQENYDVMNIEQDAPSLKQKSTLEDNSLEFVPSEELEKPLVVKKTSKDQPKVDGLADSEKVENNNIEFVLAETPPVGDAAKPIKSKAALETLLSLAKTYIEMDDMEMAKQSLQEVLDFGNEKQKTEAQRLLDEMNKK